MIAKLTCFLMFMFLLLLCDAMSQSVYQPEKGSAERTAILDALRVPVERDLKQKIIFVVDTINVGGSWAFASGRPQTPSGSEPSLKGTKFEGEEEFFDHNFFGLLRKTSGRWRVITYAIGCTDVCYADWWKRHRAPKAIFPYSE